MTSGRISPLPHCLSTCRGSTQLEFNRSQDGLLLLQRVSDMDKRC